jgi:beta-lactam-binding protein with PASTA domain
VSDVEVEERSEESEGGPSRNPFVVTAAVLLLISVVAIAWWSSRERVVSVPDVVGTHVDAETLEPVLTSLRSRELVIGDISRAECPDLTLPDTVVSQTPTAGAEVAFGTRVDLVVCRG